MKAYMNGLTTLYKKYELNIILLAGSNCIAVSHAGRNTTINTTVTTNSIAAVRTLAISNRSLGGTLCLIATRLMLLDEEEAAATAAAAATTTGEGRGISARNLVSVVSASSSLALKLVSLLSERDLCLLIRRVTRKRYIRTYNTRTIQKSARNRNAYIF
ncbi:Hypothetical predicted protein [Octopus vulgaris]|uniref:Uncharacterized protein n=1 Tax=Octopus vulgaris TaxID=6645 RepID=A0AA36BCA7_OCTVU|nr:Hypothetical predicted protein [Octopus vulgaris]